MNQTTQQYITLNNNTKMPSLGFGTAGLRNEQCIESTKTALNLGYKHIDTAESYMNELEIGEAIKGSNREDLFITSKISPTELDHFRVLAACEESLARLQTHYLDLYLIHWPDQSLNLPIVLKAMKELYDQGKIKAFGVSNFEPNHLTNLLKIANEINLPVSVNQIKFHPLLNQSETINFCKENNIIITAYSPLAKGEVYLNPDLKKIAQKYNKTPGQISLRWLLDKKTIVIPKATSIEHIKENLELDFNLNQEDSESIDRINGIQNTINNIKTIREMIPTFKLNNNNEIPTIGLGTYQLTGEICTNAVKKAIEHGYKHIDTAEIYGNEEEVGIAIQNIPREELFITTKAWHSGLDYQGTLEACERSLSKLNTNYIDLYLIHWPDKSLNIDEILRAMKILYDQKKIKAFGVSNFTINHLIDALEISERINLPISVNQVEFHPLLNQKDLLNFCREKNILITAYSPLGQGEIFYNENLIEIGKKYNKSPGQISLKWLLEKGIVVIPKGSSEDHIKENLNLNFDLNHDDLNKINNMNINKRIVNPEFAEFDY